MDRGGFDLQRLVPPCCPCCGQPTRIHTATAGGNIAIKATKVLFCDNEACAIRHLQQFLHFTGKKALNIEGLSEATLEKLIGRG